jgi:hypothetical protein
MSGLFLCLSCFFFHVSLQEPSCRRTFGFVQTSKKRNMGFLSDLAVSECPNL